MNVLGKSAIKKGVNFQKAVPLRLFTRSTTRLFQQNHYCPIHDNRRTNIRTEVVFVCSRFLLFAENPTHDLYTGWSILLASPQRAGSLRLLQTRLGLRSGIGRTSNCAGNRRSFVPAGIGRILCKDVGIWRCEGASYGIGEL